jgi:hypothetical protein
MQYREYSKVFIYVMFAFLFALSDNLFLGNFVWAITGSPAIFFVLSVVSIPVTTIFKYHSYNSLAETISHSPEFFQKEKNLSKIGVLIFALLLSCLFYLTSYGALYIQILRLFTNQFNIVAVLSSHVTFYLVIFSVIPDAILYARDLYNKIISSLKYINKVITGKINILGMDNLSSIIFCTIIVLFVASIFTNIEYSQMINSYQHYLIEVANMIIPHVWGKDIIFWLILFRFINQFWDLGKYILTELSELFNFQKKHTAFDIPLFTFVKRSILFVLAAFRAFGKHILAGELASNPLNIDAKSLAAFGSAVDDYDQYRSNCHKHEHNILVARFISLMLALTSLVFVSLSYFGFIGINYVSMLVILITGTIATYFYPKFLMDSLHFKHDVKSSFELKKDSLKGVVQELKSSSNEETLKHAR